MASTTQEPLRYCLRCRYALHGLSDSSRRCPECGREFDPSNPRTFSNHPHGDKWAAIAQFTRVLIIFSAACTVILFFMSAFGFHPIWQFALLGIPMFAAIMLVPVQIILIWIVQACKGWNALNRKWMITGLVLIAMFISIIITQWPLRLNFLLHKPWLDRAADRYAQQLPPTQSRARVGGKQWIGLLRVRQIAVLHNGNVGFQLSGDDGGGMFFVRTAPNAGGGANFVWYNSEVQPLSDNWHLAFED